MFQVQSFQDWQYVTDPHWRASYEAPRWVFDIVDKESTVSTQKAVELLDKFNGGLIEDDTVYAIRHALLPFLGDRELNVYLDWLTIRHSTNRVIVIEFDDDDGRRQIMRLS